MVMNVERIDIGLGSFYTGFIKLGDEMGLDGQARFGFSLTKQVEQQLKGQKRAAFPGFADFTENTVLDRVPFGGTGRIMTYGNRKAEDIGNNGLKLLFED